jgi:ABC-type multidrug transport system fused ATPase/permease subunit
MKLPFLRTIADRAAQVDEFGDRLPNDSDTRLGEGDVRLSRGQHERVAIARGRSPGADGVDG